MGCPSVPHNFFKDSTIIDPSFWANDNAIRCSVGFVKGSSIQRVFVVVGRGWLGSRTTASVSLSVRIGALVRVRVRSGCPSPVHGVSPNEPLGRNWTLKEKLVNVSFGNISRDQSTARLCERRRRSTWSRRVRVEIIECKSVCLGLYITTVILESPGATGLLLPVGECF